MLPVRRHLDAVLMPPRVCVCLAAPHLPHGRLGGSDDPRILETEDDPQFVHTSPVQGNAPVPRIETEQVDVVGRPGPSESDPGCTGRMPRIRDAEAETEG